MFSVYGILLSIFVLSFRKAIPALQRMSLPPPLSLVLNSFSYPIVVSKMLSPGPSPLRCAHEPNGTHSPRAADLKTAKDVRQQQRATIKKDERTRKPGRQGPMGNEAESCMRAKNTRKYQRERDTGWDEERDKEKQ